MMSHTNIHPVQTKRLRYYLDCLAFEAAYQIGCSALCAVHMFCFRQSIRLIERIFHEYGVSQDPNSQNDPWLG